jgi:hypothetical protein
MKKKSTDEFMFLVGKFRTWFADEEMDVTDFVLGRMASRVQGLLKERAVEIIGDFDSEGDGWDLFFGECCPGDDFATARNHLRLQQYERAGILVDKHKFEEQSGYRYHKPKNPKSG